MSIFKKMFSFIWRTLTFIRSSLANIIFILIIVAIVSALAPKKPALMPDNIALHIAPSGTLVDQHAYVAPLTRVLNKEQEQPETRVDELTAVIKHAATDNRITSIVLDLNKLNGGGLSKLQEIGASLTEFKASGKPIYAIGDHYTQEQYYLASYADTIYMNPMGGIIVTGFASYRNYFKDVFDKLALNFHVFRTGPYKDAVEPFIENRMSDSSKENNSLWLNELWRTYTNTIEQQRQLHAGSVDQYVNTLDQLLAKHEGDAAQLALSLGLVDKLVNHTELRRFLETTFGSEKDKPFRALNIYEYKSYIDKEKPTAVNKIGLIVARGTILDGKQPAGTIGSATFSELVQVARKDPQIKALVVRIDSGGGSAFASEVMRQELQNLRNSGIPVLISMGSVAASGGYWMAMSADEVWATPSTITGSIGVFSAFPTLEKSLEKIGIHTDGIGTTNLAGALRLDRSLSPQVESILQQSVDHTYQQFLQLVATARNLSTDAVHDIAQGRVWTGSKALELGLVDSLGSLDDVIVAAAGRANLSSYTVKEVRLPLSTGELIAEQIAKDLQNNNHSFFSSSSSNSTLSTLLNSAEQLLMPLQALVKTQDPRAIYAQCIDCVTP
jgi:protease-4